jgi:hypothetical protein
MQSTAASREIGTIQSVKAAAPDPSHWGAFGPLINNRRQQEGNTKMKHLIRMVVAFVFSVAVSGCSTTNSIPYKASTDNIISLQRSLQSQGKKVSIGSIASAPGVDESPMCRLMGPVVVAPGKSLSQYIRDAFQEELFLAQVYDPNASTVIDCRVEALTFSSVAPANWDITMSIKSSTSAGYTVSVKYPFNTSWDAYSACKNVADAFGPAVQELLKRVVTHPQFSSLAN